MAVMRMTFNTSNIDRNLPRLMARFPFAVARALNRAADSAKVAMSREIARDMGLKVSTVKEQIHVSQATTARQSTHLSVTGKRIPLIDFHARGPEPSRGRGTGVRARLPGGRGHYPRAFIATMASGHRGVFLRRGKARLPIVELHGPSLPLVFTKYFEVGKARGIEALQTNLAHELRFALQQSS